MKKVIISAAASAFFMCGIATAADSQVGRWQLLDVEYPHSTPDGKSTWVRALLKFDTVTGDMYECSGGITNGASVGKPDFAILYQNCSLFEDREIRIREKSGK